MRDIREKWVCLLYLSYNEGRVLPAVDVVQVDTLVPPSDTTVALDQRVPLSCGCLNSTIVTSAFENDSHLVEDQPLTEDSVSVRSSSSDSSPDTEISSTTAVGGASRLLLQKLLI